MLKSVPFNSSISYQCNRYYQPIKKRFIYIVLMNRESDNMGLVPYNFDPEYMVEEINSPQHWWNNRATIPLFCTTPFIFQNINNPSKILFRFSSKNMSKIFCLSSAMLESILLVNVIWYCYRHNETRTDGVMLNNPIFLLFKSSTKSWHQYKSKS